MKFYLIILLIFVSSCVSPEKKCQRAGYWPGGNSYKNCVNREYRKRSIANARFSHEMSKLQAQSAKNYNLREERAQNRIDYLLNKASGDHNRSNSLLNKPGY